MVDGVQAGDPAPDFKLPRDGKGELSLGEFKGRKLVLYFYPKDDTSGCTAEAIAFNGLAKDFAAAGAAVVGASPDPVKKHDKFRDKYELTFPLVADESKQMLEAYGVWVEKSMYGRKYMGVERTDLPDRTRRQDRQSVAQGEGAGPRRGGAGRRQGALGRSESAIGETLTMFA